MTFLPIVARELRVAARRKETHSTRLGVGLGALVLGGICAMTAASTPAVQFGHLFLQALGWVAMAYCILAGRFLTADCLSREKRDETLGLLFLTDLKGYDVVLGKIAATSLNGLFGLLTVVPMLAMTLLTGGTTLGEILRVALALFVTFLLSLAIGVFASANAWEFRSAIARFFFIMLVLTVFLPGFVAMLVLFSPYHSGTDLLSPCPIYTFLHAFTTNYTTKAADFWASAAFVFFAALLLVALASKIVPNSWQVKPAPPPETRPWLGYSFDSENQLFRRQMLTLNPYSWRAAQPRAKVDKVWTVMLIVTGAALLWLFILSGFTEGVDELVCFTVAVTLHTVLKLWITLEAAQSFAADLDSGAFELLLPTPLTPERIVQGQALALRRLFGYPLILIVGFETLLAIALMLTHQHEIAYCFCVCLAGLVMVPADIVTLSLVSMKSALTEKNITRATSKTASTVLVIPWALWAGMMALRAAWAPQYSGSDTNDWGFDLASWLLIGLGLDWFYARSACRQLSANFRQLVLKRFEPPPPKLTLRAGLATMARSIRRNVWSHPRHRKWTVALTALLVIGLSLEIWDGLRSHLPPPAVVLIGPANRTTLQAVSAGDGVYLLLPDGSLWQWGQTEGAIRVSQPVRIDPFRDWKTISINASRRLGIRQDGTLWEWPIIGNPIPIAQDKDWAGATALASYAVARKTNGTLWEWGEIRNLRVMPPLATGPPPAPPNWLPAPPPTEHHWLAQSGTNVPIVRLAARRGSAFSNSIPGVPIPISPQVLPPRASGGSLTPRAPALPRPAVARPVFSVDADGTLWVQGSVAVRMISASGTMFAWTTNYIDPIQVCRETNWTRFAQIGVPMNALGETWTLFAAPPNPAASIHTVGNLLHAPAPVQLGTNENWIALDSTGDVILAIRSDGTLWGWGSQQNIGSGLGASLSGVTQICLETNWTGFTRVFGTLMAQNRAGELWLPLTVPATASPSAWTSIRTLGQLVFTQISTNQPTQPPPVIAPALSRYEIHSDGTLWTVPFKLYLTTNVIPAYQVDPHTNWIAVATTGSTSFGLTADGTLWTWGSDLGESPQSGARSRFATGVNQFLAALGAHPSGGRGFQQKPRPLMKLQPAQSP
jgi:ABC-type transport system involved in cytochrome c biogenesis permease component